MYLTTKELTAYTLGFYLFWFLPVLKLNVDLCDRFALSRWPGCIMDYVQILGCRSDSCIPRRGPVETFHRRQTEDPCVFVQGAGADELGLQPLSVGKLRYVGGGGRGVL